jgi:RimJ/RimL family protein N-acetyltransferase
MTSPPDLADHRPPPLPGPMTLEGRYARLEPLAPRHAGALHAANGADDAIWTHLAHGPFPSAEGYAAWVEKVAGRPDPRFFAIRALDHPGPEGVASLMRATPEHGVIEVGHVCFAPALQRTRAATEAIFLLADWAFGAGYRRFEWKCDAANAASRRAAARFGFAFEGVFRRHMIVRGRNRDTAWFAMTDGDWPEIRAAHLAWLDPANFDAAGRQRRRLGDLTAPARTRAEAEHPRP